jgi:hypothetical protein
LNPHNGRSTKYCFRVLALAVFAFPSSQVLYKIVVSFQSSQRAVRELKEELEVLNGALEHCRQCCDFPSSDRLPELRAKESYRPITAVTVEVIKEYKEIITNSTDDLQEHLREIDDKLQALPLQGLNISDEVAVEQ